MYRQAILEFLQKLQQPQLALQLETLSQEALDLFWQDLQKYGKECLTLQKQILMHQKPKSISFQEYTGFEKKGCPEDKNLGEKLLAQGQMGCLILAGGQGSRLGVKVPKGVLEVTPIKGKSLFQIFCEKTLVLSKKICRPLLLAIMTSSANHETTLSYLRQNNWFGLEEGQVDLFCQDNLPFLDEKGDWMLESPGKLAVGPNGNGKALELFYQTGLWDKWKSKGVQFLNMIPVDNVLADPFDAEFLGFHCRKQAEVSLKAVERLDPQEKVGLIVSSEGKIKIIEYSDIAQQDFATEISSGSLCFALANTGLFCFSMDFIEKQASLAASMPWHLAYKEAEVFASAETGPQKKKCFLWKFESFIFDVLNFASKVEVLVCPRATSYAPLKNASGDKSTETVRAALLAIYRTIYSTIAGIAVPSERDFELDPAFWYPTDQLLAAWKGRSLPERDYIDAQDL